jgi:hypothetical protein
MGSELVDVKVHKSPEEEVGAVVAAEVGLVVGAVVGAVVGLVVEVGAVVGLVVGAVVGVEVGLVVEVAAEVGAVVGLVVGAVVEGFEAEAVKEAPVSSTASGMIPLNETVITELLEEVNRSVKGALNPLPEVEVYV